MKCSSCGVEKKTKPTAKGYRLPKGWKRHNGVWCNKCWKSKYVLRAITIPVVRPLGEGVGWPQLREALKEVWAITTAATNYVTTNLYVNDVRRGQEEKMPAMPKVYLYPDLTEQFPQLPSQSVASIENSQKAKYLRRRYGVLWTNSESLPNAKYPQSAISPSQSWTAKYVPAGKSGGDLVPAVLVTLLRGERYLLQLKGGKDFHRQLRDFRDIVEGRAIQGEIAILRKRVGGNGHDNRNGLSARDGGGQKFATRVMVKIAAWFPRKQTADRKGTLYVRSDSDAFLVALDEKQNKLRIWNADHVRRWIAQHRRQIQRWSDDQKAEQRKPRRRHASFQSRREAAVHKFRNRIESAIKETSAQITGVAVRLRFAHVVLDITDRSYFGEGRFDWSGFHTYLAQRLNQDGITLDIASGDVTPNTQEPLAESESDHD